MLITRSLHKHITNFTYMAKYEMQEMNVPDKNGKHVKFPRMIINGEADTEYLARMLAHGTTFNRGEIIGLLQGLADVMAHEMGMGKAVKLDGIGRFTPTLALREGKERETGEEGERRRNASSIRVGDVNFRADKGFVQDVNAACELERSQRKFVRSSKEYTPEQRLKLAQKYLAGHPFMTLDTYTALTGLTRPTASRELKRWTEDRECGITTSGRRTHKLFVAR